MTKRKAVFAVLLMVALSLSGCLGRGGNGGGDKNMGSPEEVRAEDYNVLYIGHSFGRVFAETLLDYSHTAGFSDHAQYIEMSVEPLEHLMHCGQTTDIAGTSRRT